MKNKIWTTNDWRNCTETLP